MPYTKATTSLPEPQKEVRLKIEGHEVTGYYSEKFKLFYAGEPPMPYAVEDVEWEKKEPVLRWVKASERLPKYVTTVVSVRWKDIDGAVHEDEGDKQYVKNLLNHELDLQVEWLDESHQDIPAPNVADLGEMQDAFVGWITKYISECECHFKQAKNPVEEKFWEGQERALELAKEQFILTREAMIEKGGVGEIWNNSRTEALLNDLRLLAKSWREKYNTSSRDLDSLKTQLSETSALLEKMEVAAATMQDQRDTNAQQAMTYMERLTKAEGALFAIIQKSERLRSNPNCNEIAEIAEGVLKEKI